MRAALTAEEKLKTLSECRKCDFLGEGGCQYENLMGLRLPCKSGLACHFNPRQPARNGKGEPIEITEKEKTIMPAKVEIDETKALDLYNQGKGDSNIAASLGVSYSTIVRWRASRCLPSHKGKVPAARMSNPSITTKLDKSTLGNIKTPTVPEDKPGIEIKSVLSPLDLLIGMLTKIKTDFPSADILADGLPIKSVTVLAEYDLCGIPKSPQVNLLTE